MPESFVNQATGRLSVEGSKMWFNCNPAGPVHWFKVNWIDKRRDKKLLYLHFTMDDNLSLSEKTKARYRSMYAGVFYLRYIKGLWKAAEGLIYTMFTDDNLYTDDQRPVALKSTAVRSIAVDYGTTNPCVFWISGTMDRYCGLIGNIVGTADQKRPGAALTHREQIPSMQMIWQSSWGTGQRNSARSLWIPLPRLL